jgi:hypothetical protein
MFLDFEKAYDRLDRGWLMLCMERMGFPPVALRWVRLMMAGTRAGVFYHGHLSPWFEVLSSAAQGSPLSPMLYVLAAQPLAARLRQLQAAGVVDGIQMPDGSLAPPCHQHADDTSLHTATVQGADAAMEHAVVPFGAASNARLSLPKCVGMLLGPGADQVHGVEPVTQVPFVAPAEHVRHLGILISAGDQPAATRAMFAKRLTAVRLHIRCWARFSLSYLGRLHIAKQVLASSIYYHASFMLPPEDLLAELVQCNDRFIVQGHWDDGPVPPLAHVPSMTVECLPWEAGGLNRVECGCTDAWIAG